MIAVATAALAALTGLAPAPTIDSPTIEPAPSRPTVEPSIARPIPVDPGVVAVVGDSITWEHADVYDRVLTACDAAPAVIDAIPGRMLTTTDGNPLGPIRSGLAAIETIERELDPDTWLIELGVNDANAGAFDDGEASWAVDLVLDLIDPDDDVVWVGTWTKGDRAHIADDFTRMLYAESRLTVVDWPAVAGGLVYDALHPTADGARTIAEGYCDAVG